MRCRISAALVAARQDRAADVVGSLSDPPLEGRLAHPSAARTPQFGFPKNFDTSRSIRPCIAVGEVDPTNVDMETFVNRERPQWFNTRDMVFTSGEYLQHLSRDFTLYPGDITPFCARASLGWAAL
jgi:2-keto-4-pentenoate hydratase/2-oxohepta-3-ene-1,7-dioic acid hydratase in catechol pathway